MPVSLLDSQLATLEPPGPDEGAITVSVEQSVAKVVDAALRQLAGADLTRATR